MVLIIDDEEKLRSLLARVISLEGFEVIQAADCRSGLQALEKQEVDIVLCDVKLPDGSGIELSRRIKAAHPETEVILLTAYGNIPDSVQAIKEGAFDYLTKGDDNDRIIPLMQRAMEKVRLSREVKRLLKHVGNKYSFENIVGRSPMLLEAVKLARKVAATDTTVLLLGETGCGKEVFAQAIHFASPRAQKPFVAVNCAAIAKELLESEMFGHKAGAFTGALRDRKGLIEEAEGGTLFLDEIGELHPELQAKLLRMLENGEFQKLGESKSKKANVRIIAATNRDLETEASEKKFRPDLYYRLSAFQIRLPALNERPGDIPELADTFLNQFNTKTGKQIRGYTPEYLQALQQHEWKGNIRELKNVIERSVILCDSDQLSLDSLPFAKNPAGSQPAGQDLASIEKEHIRKVLRMTGGNKSEAARILNIAPTTLYRKIEEYQLG